MVKGVSIRFDSYEKTIPKLLELIGLGREIKKHDRILIKPDLVKGIKEGSSRVKFVEEILKFVTTNKNPGSEVFIVEGCDGFDTEDIFDDFGYRILSEKYGIGLIDLNDTDTELVENSEFLRFDNIEYPKILREGFVISVPFLREDEELEISGALSSMLGCFPASHYQGFFSRGKNKIRKWPIKYAVHDVLKCKMPDLAIVDASDKGLILAGKPLEMDKQGAKILGFDWKNIGYLKLANESFSEDKDKKNDE